MLPDRVIRISGQDARVEPELWRYVGLTGDESSPSLEEGPIVVPLAVWQEKRAELEKRLQQVLSLCEVELARAKKPTELTIDTSGPEPRASAKSAPAPVKECLARGVKSRFRSLGPMAIHVALTHRTDYRYDRPVSLSPQTVRLRPAPHCRTKILTYAMEVGPRPHFLN